MADNVQVSTGSGMGGCLFFLVGLVLALMKWGGVAWLANISWWIIAGITFFPLVLVLFFALLALIGAGSFVGIAALLDKISSARRKRARK